MDKVTIIIPVYNEEDGISKTLEKLLPVASDKNWEIILINDGSTDKTEQIISKIDGIRVIKHRSNRGYGAALKTGIRNAKSELIAFYDADGQHTPKDLDRIIKNFHGYDMLVGERSKSSHQDWMRKPGKWLLSMIANYLTEKNIPDLNSGLRIVKKNLIIRFLHLFPNGFSFSTTSTIAFMNLGFDVGYIPIKTKKRIGKSSVRQIKHGTDTIMLILRLILMFNPLKVFVPISAVLFTIGTIYEIMYGIILFPDSMRLIPGALFILLSSVVIFLMGLVVDQISELRKHLHVENHMDGCRSEQESGSSK